jgi:hypothetical protein
MYTFSIVPMFMFSGKISDCIPVTIVSPFLMLILVRLSIEQNQYFSHSRLRNRNDLIFYFLAFIRDLTFKILIMEYLGEVFDDSH